eukprot:3344130-Rhodomonas_salina.1
MPGTDIHVCVFISLRVPDVTSSTGVTNAPYPPTSGIRCVGTDKAYASTGHSVCRVSADKSLGIVERVLQRIPSLSSSSSSSSSPPSKRKGTAEASPQPEKGGGGRGGEGGKVGEGGVKKIMKGLKKKEEAWRDLQARDSEAGEAGGEGGVRAGEKTDLL